MIEVVIACRRHRVLVCTGVHIQVELVNWEDYVLWLICTVYIYILQSVRLKGQCSQEQWGKGWAGTGGDEGEFRVLSMTDDNGQLK